MGAIDFFYEPSDTELGGRAVESYWSYDFQPVFTHVRGSMIFFFTYNGRLVQKLCYKNSKL